MRRDEQLEEELEGCWRHGARISQAEGADAGVVTVDVVRMVRILSVVVRRDALGGDPCDGLVALPAWVLGKALEEGRDGRFVSVQDGCCRIEPT